MDAIDSVLQRLDAILYCLLALHGVAVLIVNLTPTPKDDEIVGKLYSVLEKAAGLIHPRAKQLPPNKALLVSAKSAKSAKPGKESK